MSLSLINIISTILINSYQVLEVHRQVVAGTNFRLKLRLRNRIAPDCSNDEVSLHHYQNYDEDGEKGGEYDDIG